MNRKVKKVLRRCGPTGGGYWAHLIARSYAESHHVDNPQGIIKTTVQDLADELMDDDPNPRVLQTMIDAKLIRVTGSGWESNEEADIEICLLDFGGWQLPKGSAARRALESREKKREDEKSQDLQVNVTTANGCVTTANGSVRNESQKTAKTVPKSDLEKNEKTSDSEKSRDLQVNVTTACGSVTQSESKRDIERENNLGRSNDPGIPDSSNQEDLSFSSSQTVPVRSRTVSKPSAEQIEQAIAAHRERLGERNAALVDQMVGIMAEKNRSGKVAISRTLRELWQPLGDATERLSEEAIAYGLRAAIARPTHRANYALRAAENYQPPGSSNVVPISSGSQRQRLSSITDEQLDGWI